MDYLKLLQYSYEQQQGNECPPETTAAFLSESIFDFTTYDGDMDDLFGRKAVEVCHAISECKTFDYMEESPENYQIYLLMCNMPFFASRLEWGTSIRGAWWGCEQPPIESCGLWVGNEQLLKLEFSAGEWDSFILAVCEFAG